ncbi:hypothetical protein HYH02_012328 [Chlamydomonas schloesseri]|uniref:F-box domain-containing protein n=1 Tax=Chlamydomonas schloesseri TaxID=2026947 RepID=A0A835W370_9CHLO|nr:hypothetical protein HYH02_012328 [Chlamydomonas schloesseri]|eukprot:KAG2434306.1 hypothetical protein HYH02_012328 [Chlamydomonas schloesseri]
MRGTLTLNPWAPAWTPRRQPAGTSGNNAAAPQQLEPFELMRLPDAVVTTVISFLSSPSDVANCALACKSLKQHTEDAELVCDTRRRLLPLETAGGEGKKRELLEGIPKTMPGTVALLLPSLPLEDGELLRCVTTLPRLQLLDVSSRKLTHGGVTALLQRTAGDKQQDCEHGKCRAPASFFMLNLQRCFQLTTGSLDALLAVPGLSCLALSHLDLGRWGTEADALACLAAGQGARSSVLQVLVLQNCLRLHAGAIAALAAAAPAARFLMLGGCTLALAAFVSPPAAGVPHLPQPVLDLLHAAYKAAPTSTSATVAAHLGAAQWLLAAVLALPQLVALDLTFFPLPLVAAMRRVLGDVEVLAGLGRTPVEVWDFANDAATVVEQARSLLRRHLHPVSPSAGEVTNTAATAEAGASAVSAGARVADLLVEEAVRCIVRCAVNSSSTSRSTPLHMAAMTGSIAGIRQLLAGGAVVDARDTGGATALFLASEAGKSVDVCAALLAAGADPTISNAQGESPMYIAALRGHLGCVQALLRTCTSRGIQWMDPELYGDSWTPLHAAAVAGREDVAACLLQAAGAAGSELVVAPNKYGQSVVHIAARKGSAQLLRLLLSAGGVEAVVRRDGSGDTPVDVAKKNRHTAALAEFRRVTAQA